jgi:hypothetical protein
VKLLFLFQVDFFVPTSSTVQYLTLPPTTSFALYSTQILTRSETTITMPARRGVRDLEKAIDRVEEAARTSESENEGQSIAQREARASGNKRLVDGEQKGIYCSTAPSDCFK